MFIKEAVARTIKDSRGDLSVEVRIKTFKGVFLCSAPSGKSKGANEVPDYNERGVKWSVRLADEFLASWKNKSLDLTTFDDLVHVEELIKKFEKHHGLLGGNIFYAIEGALIRALAMEKNREPWEFIHGSGKPKIPQPIGNCIGSGLHTTTHFKKQDFQEFLLIPKEDNFAKAVSKNILAYYSAKMKLRIREKRIFIKTNDENALVSHLTNQEVLEILRDVAKLFDIRIGLDIAASSFYDGKRFYDYKNKRFLRNRSEQIDYISSLINEFDLFYVEDPFHEDDFTAFGQLMRYVEKTNKKTLIVGDDLTVTNLARLKRAQRSGSINAVIIKPNQIGSLIEVKKVVDFCKHHNLKMIFSHRSGETMDNLLADYAVGFGADFIKTGILGRERLIKLRRIIDIEKRMNPIF
jgi:enolase